MSRLAKIDELTLATDKVVRSIIVNLDWLEAQLAQWIQIAADIDDDLSLDRLFSIQVLILESATKLKLASEVLNCDREI